MCVRCETLPEVYSKLGKLLQNSAISCSGTIDWACNQPNTHQSCCLKSSKPHSMLGSCNILLRMMGKKSNGQARQS